MIEKLKDKGGSTIKVLDSSQDKTNEIIDWINSQENNKPSEESECCMGGCANANCKHCGLKSKCEHKQRVNCNRDTCDGVEYKHNDHCAEYNCGVAIPLFDKESSEDWEEGYHEEFIKWVDNYGDLEQAIKYFIRN